MNFVLVRTDQWRDSVEIQMGDEMKDQEKNFGAELAADANDTPVEASGRQDAFTRAQLRFCERIDSELEHYAAKLAKRAFRAALIELKPLAEAAAEIDAAWFMIDHGWECESREELERQSRTNGFKYGLAQAIHHLGKRCVIENAWLSETAVPSEAPQTCGSVVTIFPHSSCSKPKGHVGHCGNALVGYHDDPPLSEAGASAQSAAQKEN